MLSHNITLISTVHVELGKCNTEELHRIIEKLNPEVIFLEALDETYSSYEKFLFSSFGVFHKKLEISAIQKYATHASFKYFPVLNNGLSDTFDRKYNIVCNNPEFQGLIDNFNSLAKECGFEFLNSRESIKLQQEMRDLESRLLNTSEVDNTANSDIDAYENSMIRNIISYSKENYFDSAIFMCGVAHRKSIMEKIDKLKTQEQVNLNWIVFGN